MSEHDDALTQQRLAALEHTVGALVVASNDNWAILQEAAAYDGVRLRIMQRVLADAFGAGGQPYRTPEGQLDYLRYEAEYWGVQGFSGFLEAHAKWVIANPPPPKNDYQADVVFGD